MARRAAALTALALLGASCGYTSRVTGPDGGDVAVVVPPVAHPGLDPYAPGIVDRALRRAVARAAGLRLSDAAPRALRVTVADVRIGLTPFAEPGLRAAQYEAEITLTGALEGGRPWRSPVVRGAAPFLSTGGRLEALDGAGRRALGEAADEAARRLVGALVRHLRGPGRVSGDVGAETP